MLFFGRAVNAQEVPVTEETVSTEVVVNEQPVETALPQTTTEQPPETATDTTTVQAEPVSQPTVETTETPTESNTSQQATGTAPQEPAVATNNDTPATITATRPLAEGEVELVEFRTEKSKVYIMPDGLEKTEHYTFPIHFRNEQGLWEDIDPRFYRQPDGSLKSGRGNITANLSRNVNSLLIISKSGRVCTVGIKAIKINDFNYTASDFSVPNWSFRVNNDNGIIAEANGIAVWSNIIEGLSLEITLTHSDLYTELVTDNHDRLPTNIDFSLSGCDDTFFTAPTMSDSDTGGVELRSIFSDGVLRLSPDYSDLGSLSGEVRVDPSVNSGLALNVFTSQGFPNGGTRRFLLAASNFVDTTNGAWAGYAETYLLYDVHGAVWDRGNTGQAYVTGATLRIRHYTNNGAAFTLNLGRLTQGFDGNTGSGTNQWRAHTGAYTAVGIGSGCCTHVDIYMDATGIVRDIFNGGQPNYGLALWGTGGGYASGSAFCSSRADGWCQAWEAPVLTINSLGNYRPFAAGFVTPVNNQVLTGNCDRSAGTGTCYTGASQVNMHINNIGDPDNWWPGAYSYTATYYTSTYYNAAGTSTSYTSPQTNISANYGDTRYAGSAGSNRTIAIEQGRVTFYAINVDGFGANTGYWSSTTFINDYTPPATPSLSVLPSLVSERGVDLPVASLVIDNVTIKGEVSYQFELRNIFTDLVTGSVWIRPATGANTLAFQLGIGGMDGILGTPDDLRSNIQYALRVRAKDNYGNVSYWSSEKTFTVDMLAPVIKGYSASSARFSPISGRTALYTIDVKEENLDQVEIFLKDLAGNKYIFNTAVVKTYLGYGVWRISVSFDGYVKQVFADGSMSEEMILEDGIYILEYKITDLAGHELNSSNSASYNSDPENFTQYIVIIDTVAPELSVTQPYDNYTTKDTTVPVSGQVTSDNGFSVKINVYSKNYDYLRTYNCDQSEVAITNELGCHINAQGVFTANVLLDLDGGIVSIYAEDEVGNGVSTDILVNRETQAPTITDLLINGTADGSFSDGLPRVEFRVTDADNPDSTAGSGLLSTGAYMAKVSISMLYKVLQNNVLQEIRKALFANGVRLDSNFTSDLTCIPSGEFYQVNGYDVTKNINCSFKFLSALPHNTRYDFEVTAEDVAGNAGQHTAGSTFDNKVYAELYQPTFGGLYARSRILVEARASRGSTLKITHQPSGSTVNLIMHESLNGQELEGLLGGQLEVDCGLFADHDLDSATPDEAICQLKSRINTSYAENWEPLGNTITIDVTDDIGNTATRTTEFIISPTNFSVIIAPDYGFLSPNGDGNQDVLQITHQVVNPDNPDPYAQPEVAGYEWRLYNKTAFSINSLMVASGTLIRLISANTPLPYSTIFDGYLCLAPNGQLDVTMVSCQQWEEGSVYQAVPDGEYEHTLTVITFEGAHVTSGKMPLLVKSTMSDTVVLTSPQPATTTTSGVVLVSGVGPASINRPLTSTLRGNVTVVICIDSDEQGADTVCNSRVTVSPNSVGAFSTLVTLPAPTTINQTYRISAYALDQFGVRTPSSAISVISYDRRGAIVGVAMEPGISGITTNTTTWSNYLNATKTTNVEQVAYQLVTVVVSQGTEVIYLKYADSVTPDAIANGTLNFRDIGVYGDQTEALLKQNPRKISAVKSKLQTNLATYTYNNLTVCKQTTCVWSVYIPISPTALGGQYALDVTAKKGDSLDSRRVYYQVYRESLVEPIMVLMDSRNRISGYDNYNVNVALLPTAYYTDANNKPVVKFTTSSSYITVRGVGVAGKTIKVIATSEGKTFTLCSSVKIPTSGIFTCNADLVPHLKVLTGITAPVNYLFPNTSKTFLVTVQTKPGTGETVRNSKNVFELVYDTKAPQVTNIQIDTVSPNLASDDGNAFSADTRSLTGPMNGWVSPGGYADYYLTVDKVINFIDVTKESGYITKMTEIANLVYKVRLIVDRITAGYYSPTFLLVDQAGNKNTLSVSGNNLTTTEISPGKTTATVYALQTSTASTNFGKFVSSSGKVINDFRAYEDDRATDPTEFALNGEIQSDYVYGDFREWSAWMGQFYL
jgi:hypothetical protein